MTVRVTIDENGVNALMRSPQTAALVTAGARQLARTAGDVAPKGGPAKGLAESYRGTPAHPTPLGIAATAYTTDIAGHLAEFGSINNPAYAPLRRAAARLGLRVRLHPKGAQ